jgi:uncharacterized membrane protein
MHKEIRISGIVMAQLSAAVINTLPPIVITLSYFRHQRIWLKRNVEVPKYTIEELDVCVTVHH